MDCFQCRTTFPVFDLNIGGFWRSFYEEYSQNMKSTGRNGNFVLLPSKATYELILKTDVRALFVAGMCAGFTSKFVSCRS